MTSSPAGKRAVVHRRCDRTAGLPEEPPQGAGDFWNRLVDALTAVGSLADGTVDCLISSPPPWVREATTVPGMICEQAYASALQTLLAATRRVLTAHATVWLHLTDTRTGSAAGVLQGTAWQVARALQDDGWILRSAIVCHHAGPSADLVGGVGEPGMKREGLASRYSWLFLLVAQPDYFFDLDAIRRPYTGDRALSRRRHRSATRPHTARGTWPRTDADTARGSNPGNVWSFSEQPGGGDNRDNEPSNEPPTSLGDPGVLAEMFGRCIAVGCPPGGLVLDPIPASSRAAPTAARALGRAFTGPDSRLSRSVRACRVP